jgi:hypothetical protein
MTMTDDELETERAALEAELNKHEPLSDEVKRRIADLAAEMATRPRTPYDEALYEALQEMVALSDRDLPPGLDVRLAGDDGLEVLSRGEVIGTLSRSALAEREAQIAADRARYAEERHLD